MNMSRRKLLVGSASVGAGLLLGFQFRAKSPVPGTLSGSFQPNAWLQITDAGRVIFQLHKVEMGQGVMTSLATIIGEELDFDPAKFEVQMAGVHPDFSDPNIYSQMTGASASVRGSWTPLREAGAAARALLVAAAAQRWGISPSQCDTDDGQVFNSVGGQRLSYAELASEASRLKPVSYQLKAAADYRWIGQSVARLDSVDKSTGRAEFGMDVIRPCMKTSVVVRCPHFGGRLESWQKDSVIGLDGVLDAFVIHSGIAIVADGYWPARKAAQALQVQWHKGPLAGLNSAKIRQGQEQALEQKQPHLVLQRGDVDTALAGASEVLDVKYGAPYFHHSPMEPQNATALYTLAAGGNHCEVWAPNQAPDICRELAVEYGGVEHANVEVHTTLLGGGFGRRGYPDFVAEVVAIAKQVPGTPIKLIWSREDDMQHDYYRAATFHSLKGAVNPQGTIEAWQHHIVAPSILRGLGVSMMSVNLPPWVPRTVARSLGKWVGAGAAGFDPTTAEGAKIPYTAAHVSVGQIEHDPGVPHGFWRSVGFSYNSFASESFVDELAQAAGRDPLDFRLQQLPDSPRQKAVLQLAAEKAGWGQARAGISQGIAVAEPFLSHCAMVVEVSVVGNQYTVERVVAAVDCGLAINPAIIVAQVQSGIVYGLTAAIKNPVTIEDGRVLQSNFHDLPVLRINESPVMEVFIVDSLESPTGIGEVGVPTVAPALANALFAATGQRLRELPLRLV